MNDFPKTFAEGLTPIVSELKQTINQLVARLEFSENADIIHSLRYRSLIASLSALGIGCIVLLGWVLDIRILTTFIPDSLTMKANSSICFILGGFALWLWHKRLTLKDKTLKKAINYLICGFAISIAIVALLTLAQYAFGWNMGIDELFFKDSEVFIVGSYPGRMGINAGINFFLLSLSLLFLYRKKYFLSQLLTVFCLLIALLVLLGYLFDTSFLHRYTYTAGMALPTTLNFILLSLGILFARPDRGIMEVFTNTYPGGSIVRRLSLVLMSVPLALSGLVLLGYREKLYSAEIAIAIFGILNIAILTIPFWLNARSLSAIETQRQQLLEVLKLSEERLKLALDGTDDGLWDWNIATSEVYFSPRWLEMIGYQPGELEGTAETWSQLLHPEDKPKVMTDLYQHLEGHVSFYKPEFRMRTKSGDWQWILASGKVVSRDASGKPLRMVGTHKDISDRKQAEEALIVQKQMLRTIIDNAPIWVWMTNLNGRMVLVNQTFCQDIAIPESQFLAANHYSELLGSEESANCMASDFACLRQKTPHYSEELFPFADGKLHHLEVIKTQIKDGSGRLIGLIGLGVDVTDRKQAQYELQASEARFRKLAQQETLINQLASQIRASLDLNTILATTVEKIRNFLQIDRCLFIWYFPHIQFPIWHIVHEAKDTNDSSHLGDYPADLVQSFVQSLSTLTIYRVERVAEIRDVQEREFFQSLGYQSVLGFPIQTSNEAIGMVASVSCREIRSWRDEEIELLQAIGAQLAIAISQAELYNQTRITAQEAQAQAQQLSEAFSQLQTTQMQLIQAEKMSSLGQMVAGIAHEINNPVSFIFGNIAHTEEYTAELIELLQLYQRNYPEANLEIDRKLASIDLDFLLEDLPKIVASMKIGATRIRDIVKSLRTFARLDEAEMKEVDIHENLNSTLLILEHRLVNRSKGLAIQVIKEYGQLPLVNCYAGQLNQVFMNILANAIDALESLKIYRESCSAPSIRIQTERVDPYAAIRILDNGFGIAEEVKKRIFDPFFTTKEVGKGTGMGLAIAHSIVVKKHQGRLRCNSEVGKGTEFIIEIPLQQQTLISSSR